MRTSIDIQIELNGSTCTKPCPFGEISDNGSERIIMVGSIGCHQCDHRISREGDMARCGHPTIKKNVVRRINLRGIR